MVRVNPVRSRPPTRALRLLASVLGLLLAVVLLAGCGAEPTAPSPSPTAPSPSLAARVDGRDVPVSAVEGVRAESRLLGEDLSEQEAFDQAVERELLRREAERLGVTADKDSVQQRVDAVTTQLGGEAGLEAALKKAGMTRAQLQESLEEAELLAAVAKAKFPELRATAAQARRFYERNREGFTTPAAVDLGAIFVRNEGIAGNALSRLEEGRPFEEVSRQFSIDPQLKDNAGHLGWIDPSSLPGKLATVVGTMRKGEVSAPVAAGGGVWILKVFDRRAERTTPFSEVREGIVGQLTRSKQTLALEDWLAKERKSADVTRF